MKDIMEKTKGKNQDYVPLYLENYTMDHGQPIPLWFKFVQFWLRLLVKIFLQPRKGPVGDLNIHEVEGVYNREALTYDIKHHLTTHGMDLMWRRWAGWGIVNIGRDKKGQISVLDLCTGTGLAIKEMAILLSEWGIKCFITGLDYNVKMLNVARSRNIKHKDIDISYVRGDAMNLVQDVQPPTEIKQFTPNSFDAVTQVFGIGGIDSPSNVFKNVLQILKPGGQFFLTDMHHPITSQPGEWPFMLKWFSSPRFEALVYREITLPLVLNRLWGWRDTTLNFYLLPLITYIDEEGIKWGFKVVVFEYEAQRWWFNLPIMPIAKIVVEKVRIDDNDFKN